MLWIVGVTLWEAIVNWFERCAFCALSLVFVMGLFKISEAFGYDPFKGWKRD